jgi:hypothetical protein
LLAACWLLVGCLLAACWLLFWSPGLGDSQLWPDSYYDQKTKIGLKIGLKRHKFVSLWHYFMSCVFGTITDDQKTKIGLNVGLNRHKFVSLWVGEHCHNLKG